MELRKQRALLVKTASPFQPAILHAQLQRRAGAET